MIRTTIKLNVLLKELRVVFYKNQIVLARVTGLDRNYISKVETGKIKVTDEVLRGYANGLGISVDELNNKLIHIEQSLLRENSDTHNIKDEKHCKCKEELERFNNRQKRIFDNKEAHGFNITNIYQEARYILEETAELMHAIEKNDRVNMKEELADIVIFAYGCAEVARLGSLDDEIFKKMAINENRVYKKTADGDFVKDNK